MNDNHKKRIFWQDSTSGNSKLGLFGLLQSKLQGYTNDTTESSTKWKKEEILAVKEKFINNCGQHMSSKGTENIPITFKVSGTDLVPEDTTTFDHWFLSEAEGKKTLHMNASG